MHWREDDDGLTVGRNELRLQRRPPIRPDGQIRVLIADDSRLVAEALMFALDSDPAMEAIGYGLDGWEALELAAMLEPDVILLGTQLPGLDTLTFTRLVRAFRPQTLVIVLAQTQIPHEVEAAYAVGAADYLPKDRSADDLLAAIGAACARRATFERSVGRVEPELRRLSALLESHVHEEYGNG
jgi:DNA-binding NarL/FixJ family response regulator